MSDIIRLLPDSVANQIAAGEVVQRPASAVKELLENTIDAGATDIKLIIRDAGKLLIQVNDNGCGMSERDTRMCFERHATSKITKADDLRAIRTLGFRGEALASIASVAQVELKTKRHEDEIGTAIVIEGTEFKGQSPVNCPNGTSVSVKNLFFNVPARRNFLKSNTLELRYIIEEFFRVALAHPGLAFTFYNQDKILYQVTPGNLKQRIVNLFGAAYNQRLIPLEVQTGMVNISGFICKPEFAKKTRGEQYFFTNGRYMKSAYLHHAVDSAFRELIPEDSIPSYFLYLEVDPETIDVNIHPTKTEINFQDFKSIYTILHAAVKQSIGKFSLSPTLDFESEQGLNIPPPPPGHLIQQPVIRINPEYNPFEKKTQPQTSFSFPRTEKPSPEGWQELYRTGPVPKPPATTSLPAEPAPGLIPDEEKGISAEILRKTMQAGNGFIVTYIPSGMVIIDPQHAHERILYERILQNKQNETAEGQRLLLPQTITLNQDDAHLLLEWTAHFKALGFEIDDFGNGSFVVNALPVGMDSADIAGLIESIIESLKSPGTGLKENRQQILARQLAKRLAVKRGKRLQQEETDALVEYLFACHAPGVSPEGKPTMWVISAEELNAKFKLKPDLNS